MCFKNAKADRSMEARRRLAERQVEPPRQTTRPRGNAPVDERDLRRSMERLEALVGR
jgi:hypothetical protein